MILGVRTQRTYLKQMRVALGGVEQRLGLAQPRHEFLQRTVEVLQRRNRRVQRLASPDDAATHKQTISQLSFFRQIFLSGTRE